MDIFNRTTVPLLEKALNGASLNQKIISQNIANVDTPHYKAKKVVFRDALDQAISAHRTESRHMSFGGESGYRVTETDEAAMQNNGNSVDIDKEMSKLAKSQIEYQTLVSALNHKFQQYKLVLRGGR
ncbi:flagellar basal-body rod protein FlgB [Scopulibacillus darangshiensis]|uniref:Flagellar basal body rod protein FlgB n=1 Tax=Scopulibacillus darangshiensis TaxID=442528 RepID=A0A4R2P345_9BACL|nr:flagellar basal body rod protein FlgB [Scopulibacillus darangshiensis]TCP29179.1 flagellar basal-body rod protein FlgB [Scopulibacillus darangshiensis]